MAKATKKSETKVTRITASESASKKSVTLKKKPTIRPAKTTEGQQAVSGRPARVISKNPLVPLLRYIKGSWHELRQVRWPDRRATWKMTGALIAFTVFFVVVILLIDAGFGELFKLLIGK